MTKTRGEKRLASITYSAIADWAGLSLHTVRRYAARGDFDGMGVPELISWVNGRRSAKGLPMIGQPAKVDREVQPVENPIQPKQPEQSRDDGKTFSLPVEPAGSASPSWSDYGFPVIEPASPAQEHETT